jgi:hypothetical protein
MKRALFSVVVSSLAFSALAFAASSARAAEQDMFNAATKKGESPQHFALEIRISPYVPNIDSESSLNGKTPYKDTFGTMPRALVGVEFDWQALRIPMVGTLGPGVALSYTQMTDKSFTLQGTRSNEDTNLNLYPMYLVAVLRADVFWTHYKIPFVPYAKAGVGLAFWEITNPGGLARASTSPDGSTQTSGRGHTWGTQWAAGVGIALDSLDPGASRNLDMMVGINNTYLYGEYYLSALTGLGQSHPLLVGTDTWCAGLAFEF